jgi:hypothetical protein
VTEEDIDGHAFNPKLGWGPRNARVETDLECRLRWFLTIPQVAPERRWQIPQVYRQDSWRAPAIRRIARPEAVSTSDLISEYRFAPARTDRSAAR